MSDCKRIERAFYVHGHQCTATVDVVGGMAISVEFAWKPFPKKCGHRFMMEYRKKRDAVIKVVATEIGNPIAIINFDVNRQRLTTILPDEPEQTR